MIRAAIFDMGNTLLRFERPGTGTWREVEERGIHALYRYLLEEGHPIQAQEDVFVEAMFARLAMGWEQSTGGHINLRAAEWIAAGVADDGLMLDEQALIAAVHAYARPMQHGITVVPGAKAALAELRRRGVRIGLISNTIWPAELHLADLEQLGLREYLEYTIFSGDAGIWKPTPQIFERALTGLGVAPHEAIFIGDNPREDILGAQAIGMRAILVRGREFALGDVHPAAIIEDQTELLAAIEKLPNP